VESAEAGRALLGNADRARPAGLAHRVLAMAMKYLGDTLDIHTGGIDLAFPHHENEIAQSEAATGKPFARYWLHAEHLLVEGEKMSKSLGNFYTLRGLFAKGYKPSALRFALASVPYRKQLNFTFRWLAAGDELRRAAAEFRGPPEARKIPCREAEGHGDADRKSRGRVRRWALGRFEHCASAGGGV